MTTWQNNPGGGYYAGQQGYPGYPGGNPGYPGGNPGYPGGDQGYPGGNQGYPGGNQGYPGGYPPPQGEGYPGFQPPSYPGGVPPPAPGFAPPPAAPPYGQVPPQPGMYGTNYDDGPIENEIKGFEFNDASIRQGFIRKVYCVLMMQLLITFSIISIFAFNEKVKNYAAHNMALMYVCLGITLVLLIAMACCTSVRRKAPMNYVFLFVFTAAEGVLLGFVCSQRAEYQVLMAVGVTAVICFGLTLFAFQTKIDFTGMGTYLFVAALVLMIFGILSIFFHNNIVAVVYGCLGALIFSMYLVYDTQLMLGGKHKYSLSPEEYIFAALNLYLDIINIFMYILTIISSASRD